MVARNQASETGRIVVNFDIFFKRRTLATAPLRTLFFCSKLPEFLKKNAGAMVGSGA